MRDKGTKTERTFNIYSVKDEMTGLLLQPIFIETEEEVVRWFKHVLNKTELWKDNPTQFSLYWIGTFNEKKGVTEAAPELVIGGAAVKENNE